MATTDKLNLGLDDIIRMDRSSNRRGGRGAGGNGGNRGMMRGRPNRGAGGNGAFRNRGGGGLPRGANAQGGNRWKNDFYGNNNTNQFRGNTSAGERTTGVNSTTKLLISNLESGVTTDDIQELFGEIGAVRTARVHFDEDGQSLGTAEVIYERRADAVAAQKKYNTLNLDGRPMEISLVGGSDNRVQSARFQSNGRNQGGGNGTGFRNNNNNNRPRNTGRTQQQQQQRRPNAANNNNNKKEDVTAEDLDADLDAYKAESKEKK